MTDTANLALPLIEGGQAQKHVTHNEALRILDAAVQIAVLDLTRTAPPSSPAEGERHVVATGATGAWSGHARAVATWQNGAWSFLAPHAGWCIWSVADNVMFVFDGTVWRDLRDLPVTLDNVAHVGVNTVASSPNLLSVKSNAALLAAIALADGGSGDARLQVSKESTAKTASVVFANNFSGRAEIGLVGSDAFKLKVSPDGSAWTEALAIDPTSGNLSLPRGLMLSGVIAPAQITSNQNDYAPTGLVNASALQLSTDASRNISGLANGAEGRVVAVINVGSQPVVLLDESSLSTAANRFTLGGSLTLLSKQAVLLRYDATASRWQMLATSSGLRAGNNLSDVASAATAQGNLGVLAYANAQMLTTAQQAQARGNAGIDIATLSKSTDYTVVGADYGALLKLTGTHTLAFTAAATLGDKFRCRFRNVSTGVWTLDPNGSETVNGLTAWKIYPGESGEIVCDGSAFFVLGLGTGLILLDSQIASASATLDFTRFDASRFASYRFVFNSMLPATSGANLLLRVSTDGGASYVSSSSYYHARNSVTTGATQSGAGAAPDTAISLAPTVGNVAGNGPTGKCDVDPSGATWSTANYQLFYITSGSVIASVNGGGIAVAGVNALRLLFSTGNIASGAVQMFGGSK